ncbi:MAG: RNA polymerase sigma factor [Actinomycetota bacterium]|nr:RNA polymerase sigma factor [Actinomycetota bacterium]
MPSVAGVIETAIAVPAVKGRWSGALSVDEAKSLITKAKIGDRDAFAALYKEYVPHVHRYVASRVQGSQKVEDIVAETFVRALRSINRYEFRGIEFTAWLVRIARNLIVDVVQSNYATLEVSHDIIPESASSEEVETKILESSDAETLRATMDKLVVEHKTVLELRFVQGRSVIETAKVMGKSDGAVRVLQFRALKAMKRELLKDSPDLFVTRTGASA